ncbi:MAG: lysostaphin resistance A-like protein [Velocimicrobium sp.]
MKKIGTVIVGVLIVIGAMILRELVAAVEIFVYAGYKIINGTIKRDEIMTFIQSMAGNSDLLILISMVGTIVWIIVFGILYKNTRKLERKTLFEGILTWKRVGILFVMGLGLQFLINSILGIVLKIAPSALESYKQVIETLGMGNSLLSLVYVVVIAPIGEELVFRATTMHYLKQHLTFFAANLIQALFFGFFHMNLVQGIYAFALGLVLGWVAEKYGSIRESIVLHMAVNASGCLVGFIMPEALFENGWGLALLFFVAICLLVFSGKTVRMEKVRIENMNMVE